MTVPIVSQTYNPVTGVFGTGQLAWFSTSGIWVIPAGIGKCRVRVWGAGASGSGSGSGSGGGFALKVIYDLSEVTTVAITVGIATINNNGGTSSFGSFVSATGGNKDGGIGGSGIGGDINTVGGSGVNAANAGGGGSGSLFGNGGAGGNAASGLGSTGGAGGGAASSSGQVGGAGFLSTGAFVANSTNTNSLMPTTGMSGPFSIDFIGCGGGGGATIPGINGGGGGSNSYGGFPGGGGGGGNSSPTCIGASGLVIVEY